MEFEFQNDLEQESGRIRVEFIYTPDTDCSSLALEWGHFERLVTRE